MKSPLKNMLETMGNEARRANLSNADWAARAGVRAETLSRLKQRGDCDLATLAALAEAVNLRVTLVPRLKMSLPTQFDRDDEERLLALCSSRSLDLAQWQAAGSRFFTAGVAMLLASVDGFDRHAWLQLAEALYPGMGSIDTFRVWLKKSPLRPSRFLPMLEQRLAH
jgi:hypothetical protein